jgi:YVTN family beta-propeller protein
MIALLVALAACGDDATSVDAGRDAGISNDASFDGGGDAAPTGPLVVSLEGATLVDLAMDACFDAVHNGGDASLEWIWGDETRETTAESRRCHRFPYPGEFLVSVRVTARDMEADATMVVTALPWPTDPPPSSASPIAYDAERDRVWVVNPDSDTVAMIDATALALVREIPVCEHPRTVAVAGSSVFIACQGNGVVQRLDAESGESRAEIDIGAGSEPYGVIADPRGERVWVSLRSEGRVIAIAGDRVAVSIGDLREPRGLSMNAEGLLLVTRYRSDAEGAYVATVDARDPSAPVLRGVARFDRDTERDSDTDNNGVFSFLNQVVFAPDGTRALVPALKANNVTGVFRTAAMLSSQTTARAAIGELSLSDGVAVESFRHSFDDLDYASALAFRPTGARVYVAMQGAEIVLELDPFSFNVTGSIDGVGFAPQGLVTSPDGSRLFVQAFLSRAVRVYDVRDLSRDPEPLAEIATTSVDPLSAIELEGKRVFYRSRDPRMSRTSYLSCASCHLDGEGDSLVWDFTQRGEGLRNTVELRGRAGVDHGPLHWSANFDELQDFEHDIRVGQGGTGFLSEALFRDATPLGSPKAGLSPELDALAAYVESLGGFGVSPFRRDDPGWRDAFARGEAVFDRAGCRGCHSGSRFTDSAFPRPGEPLLHEVGTFGEGSGGRVGAELTGLDTPTLRGLWRSAPYLHDGSATLRDLLTTRNAADRHGTTSDLDDAELDDLETYLLALDDLVP